MERAGERGGVSGERVVARVVGDAVECERLVGRDVGELLGYVPGANIAVAPPLSLTLEEAPVRMALE